jgi:hypothetical protein
MYPSDYFNGPDWQLHTHADAGGEITIRLNSEDREKLRKLSAILGVSEEEAVRRAIATEFFVRSQLWQGSKIVLAQGDKSLREINFPS